MAKNMDDLNRLMATVAGLPKREKTEETNWRLWHLVRTKEQVWVTLDLGEKGSIEKLVAKGTYLGALLRYYNVEHVAGAQLIKNGKPCNLSEKVETENELFAYK
jgi:hypothetical protein